MAAPPRAVSHLSPSAHFLLATEFLDTKRVSLCVCVCVCVWGREIVFFSISHTSAPQCQCSIKAGRENHQGLQGCDGWPHGMDGARYVN